MKNIIIEDAILAFKNFSGEAGKYNPAGRRNFSILLTDSDAEMLERDGWNVKWLKPKDENESPQGYIQVAVTYGDKIPERFIPRVYLINDNKVKLTEENISVLDWADIITADVEIRAFEWEVNGATGIKAQLQELYVEIKSNRLADKYKDVPDSPTNF